MRRLFEVATTAAFLAGCNGDRAEVSTADSGFGVDTQHDPGTTQSSPTTTTTTTTTGMSESSQSTGPTTGTSGVETGGGTTTTSTGASTEASTTEAVAPFCGDGQVDPDEACDEGGNNGLGIGCTVDCALEVCGDGLPGPGEDCDLGALNGPEGGCSAACQFNPSACGTQTALPVLVPRPVDIVVVIDNSGSMAAEIKGVQDNINENFAEIIEASGLDYRVILLSRYGKYTSTQVCIEAPLSGIPKGGCTNPPSQPINNPGKFYHYSVEIDSTDSWCRILDTFNGTQGDLFKFAPKGWQGWLRDDAFKIFIEVSDDRVVCSHGNDHYNDNNTIVGGANAAEKFDNKLREVSPLHFGKTPESRNYSYYSIVGLSFNDPANEPYAADDPIVTTKCPSGVNGGIGHQSLSVATGALRFPLCDTTAYDALFQALAGGVIADATIACEFPVPSPPEGKELDEESIVVKFTPMDVVEGEVFQQVAGPDWCTPKSFYVDDGKVVLCTEACLSVQNDKDATIEVEFKCAPIDPG